MSERFQGPAIRDHTFQGNLLTQVSVQSVLKVRLPHQHTSCSLYMLVREALLRMWIRTVGGVSTGRDVVVLDFLRPLRDAIWEDCDIGL